VIRKSPVFRQRFHSRQLASFGLVGHAYTFLSHRRSLNGRSHGGKMMSRQQQFDLAIVGAGIVGLAHALAAIRRGLSVVVIDRDAQANGASVRNFGFITVSGQERGQVWRRAKRSKTFVASGNCSSCSAYRSGPAAMVGCMIPKDIGVSNPARRPRQ